jgi:hypothetical protein
VRAPCEAPSDESELGTAQRRSHAKGKREFLRRAGERRTVLTRTEAGWIAKRGLLLFGALTLLLYWPMLLGRVPFPAYGVIQFPPWDALRDSGYQAPRTAEMGDLVTELYPWKAYTRQSLAAGTLPLWNPHLLMGAPFLGDLQTALFYPLNLVYYFLPTPLAWSLSILIRTILTGILAALLASGLGARRTAALTSGVIFAFCGWVTAFQTRPHLDTSLWLPLVFLSIDRLQRKADGASIALAASAFALPVLAGQPENAAHVTMVGLAFFLYRWAWPREPPAGPGSGRRRFGAFFVAAGLLALCLAAVQMLPALEFIGQLDRSLASSWGSKPLHEIAAFLSRDLGTNPNSANVPIPESAAYAGMLTLLVAPFALLHKNRRDAIFFAVLGACALQIVYGRGPAYWLSLRTPVLSGIPNGRLLVVADLCLAVLAGLGISAFMDEGPERRRFSGRWWLLAGAAFGVSALGVALILSRAKTPILPSRLVSLSTLGGPFSSAVVLVAAGALLGLALAGLLSRRAFAALALVFVAGDLVTASYRFFPYTKPDQIFPPAPTFEFLKRDPEPHRVASVDVTWGSSFELMYGLDSATGYTVLLRRVIRLLAPLGVQGNSTSLVSEKVVASRSRLLDLANVKYVAATTWNRSAEVMASRPDRFRLVFTDRSVRVFENLSVLPRAFLVPAASVRTILREDDQLAAVSSSDFDPAQTVILEKMPPAASSRDGRNRPTASNVTSFEQGINDARLRVEVAQPSILVVSQMNYPGWIALVDDEKTPLLRVDYAFVGVALGPGAHEVRLRYRPWSLRIGGAVSVAALLACVGLCGLRRRSNS